MTRNGKSPTEKAGFDPGSAAPEADALPLGHQGFLERLIVQCVYCDHRPYIAKAWQRQPTHQVHLSYASGRGGGGS